MKNLFLIISFFFFHDTSVFSQRIIEVNYVQDSKGNYNFYCRNNGYCNYILEISFTSLENTKSDHALPYRGIVKPGVNQLFKLSKENADNPFQFKYAVNYTKGCINPKVDINFTYLLPIAAGKGAQAYVMDSARKSDTGNPSSGGSPQQVLSATKNWYVIRLKMKPGDTLYAARRGVVTEVDDKSNLNDSGVASAGSENYIEINHTDCSFGHYGILKKSSAFVKPGQFVEAGQSIGLVGGDRYGRGSEARFSVYYNVEEEGTPAIGIAGRKVYWEYVPLIFWTKDNGKGSLKHGGVYTSEHPLAIIIRETKKPETKKGKPKRKLR